jgi:hypothetical protein
MIVATVENYVIGLDLCFAKFIASPLVQFDLEPHCLVGCMRYIARMGECSLAV